MSPEPSLGMAKSEFDVKMDAEGSDEEWAAEDRLCTQLNHAATEGDLGIIAQLLDNVAIEAPAGARHPLTQQLRGALSTAVESRRHNIAEYLLRKGAVASQSMVNRRRSIETWPCWNSYCKEAGMSTKQSHGMTRQPFGELSGITEAGI